MKSSLHPGNCQLVNLDTFWHAKKRVSLLSFVVVNIEECLRYTMCLSDKICTPKQTIVSICLTRYKEVTLS